MKKIIALLAICILNTANTFSQEVNKENELDYNRWSFDINTGLSRPTTPFSVDHYVEDLSFFHVDFGARYMFNPKFGLKADIGIDKFDQSKSSLPFSGEYNRVNLQGVANLGRILNFEDWTGRLNAQFHTGLGYGYLKSNNFTGKDEVVNYLLGLTAQFRLSNRVALNADFTMVNNISQKYTFDGNPNGLVAPVVEDRGFNATLYNASVGFSIYLGKHNKHADWTSSDARVTELEKRVDKIETDLNDTDRDGVVDFLDLEPNTIAGLTVDTKGRAIDNNQNGVPDEMEAYLETLKNNNKPVVVQEDNSIENLIDGGYINVFFDFNSSKPIATSYENIYFVVNYLRNNPDTSVDIIGYADEIGDSEYNDKLSSTRASNVKEIIVKSGIESSRLNILGKGEDTSVDSKSKDARKLVRRVTFKLK